VRLLGFDDATLHHLPPHCSGTPTTSFVAQQLPPPHFAVQHLPAPRFAMRVAHKPVGHRWSHQGRCEESNDVGEELMARTKEGDSNGWTLRQTGRCEIMWQVWDSTRMLCTFIFLHFLAVY